MRAAWKAAVAAAEGSLAGEVLATPLTGDEESTRRFLVGVSGKGARASVRFFEGDVAAVGVFFVGDLK